MPAQTTAQRRHAAIKAAGGSHLNLFISRDATDALAAITEHKQETKTAVIERLLIQAAARISKRECQR